MFRVIEGQEIVFHLAALIAIPYSYQSRSYVADQRRGHAERAGGRRRSASPARRAHLDLRGLRHGADVPIDEKHPLQGQSPYAAQDRGRQAGRELPPLVRPAGRDLRPFNTFGPRQSARAIIPTIISQALSRAGPSSAR